MNANQPFNALKLDQDDGNLRARVTPMNLADLPQRDLLVRVDYSTLNYKDALAITGKGKVIRDFPMVPGIDLAGEVVESAAAAFKPGDRVISTGWGVGERYWGGLSRYARLDAHWPLPLPAGISAHAAMAMGTGGFTAALCVLSLADWGVKPQQGPVLVTGAGGGVGGVSVRLLSALGYEVHALSGRAELDDYLRQLGATEIIARDALDRDAKPLEKETWAGVVDAVGGRVLAAALAQTRAEGMVASCGNAGGIHLKATVFPFILRGVALRGVNSVTAPRALRERAWQLIAEHVDQAFYELITDREIGLHEVIETCETLLAGKIRGRVIVKLTD